MQNLIETRAELVRVGDIAAGSKQTVLAREFRPGWQRVHLTLKTRTGTVREAQWNRRTTLRVLRSSERGISAGEQVRCFRCGPRGGK